MSVILDNYSALVKEVASAAESCGRDPGSIRILAVSKTVAASTIQEAIDLGIRLFGENRVQEAGSKISELRGDFSFHLVGHLQSNKAGDAVRLFDVIHSIDKAGTAEKVEREAERAGKKQKILIQVNTSGEDTKSGVSPDKAIDLCTAAVQMRHLELLGLMTIGPFTDDTMRVRVAFAALRKLLEECNSRLGLEMRELSMGMSSDYRIAIEEGATMLRIGTALFGSR